MNVIPPFLPSVRDTSISNDFGLTRAESVGHEILHLIPAEAQDAYHFIEIVMSVRHAFFQTPRCMTLNRFRYMITELSRVHQVSHLLYLDPFMNISEHQQAREIQHIDQDMFEHLDNTMILGVGLSGDEILKLPIGPRCSVVPFVDTHLTRQTPHGYLRLVFRAVKPTSVEGDSEREVYLRQLASTHESVSVRTSFLLTDPMFPLSIVPGVLNHKTLVSLAQEAKHI